MSDPPGTFNSPSSGVICSTGFLVGKRFGAFRPAGPALVALGEFEWGNPLKIRTEINGKAGLDGDTSYLYSGVDSLVRYINHAMALLPGELIAIGSPVGIALFVNAARISEIGRPRKVCEIERVGAIEYLGKV